MLGRLGCVGPKPVRRPVERSQEGARRDRGVGRPQLLAADARRHERPHTALVAIALVDNPRPQARRQRVDLEMGRGAFDLVDQAEDVRPCEVPQTLRERRADALRTRQRDEQLVERAVLAEEQDLVLAAEIVIQVAGREVGGHRDVAHAGGREAARAEDRRRGLQDGHAPGIGAT